MTFYQNPALTLDELAALESPPPSPTSLKKSIGQTLSQSKKRAGTLTNVCFQTLFFFRILQVNLNLN